MNPNYKEVRLLSSKKKKQKKPPENKLRWLMIFVEYTLYIKQNIVFNVHCCNLQQTL